jgi:hypothetical protein
MWTMLSLPQRSKKPGVAKSMPTTRNPRRGNATVITKLAAERARQQKEHQAAEMELQWQMNAEKEKRQAEKKKRDEEKKQEEELRKKMEDEWRKQEESALKDKIREASESSTVSPEEFIRHPRVNLDGDGSNNQLLQSGGADMDINIEDVDTNETQEGNDALRSPPKKSARFSNVKKARSKPSTLSGWKESSKQAPPKIGKCHSAKEEHIKNPAAQACSSPDDCGVINPAPGGETRKLLHQSAEGITSKWKDGG